MSKFLLLFSMALLFACTNQTSEKNTTDKNAASVVATTLSAESEMEILSGCVAEAKANNVDEAKAFALCRCVLRQMQEKYPTADSAQLVAHLRDTAEVVQLTEKCE